MINRHKLIEEVADLREKAQIFEDSGCATNGIVKTFREAADTIEKLTAKLAIESQPPADQWIPCSERPPEEPCIYTVEDCSPYTVNKHGEPQRRTIILKPFTWEPYHRVIAWKPINTEPYKGVE